MVVILKKIKGLPFLAIYCVWVHFCIYVL